MIRLLILLVLVVAVVLVAVAIVGAVRARALRYARWEVVEQARGDVLEVWVARSRSERLQLGTVTTDAPDFEDQLYELRAEGRMRCAALNEHS